MGIQPTLSHEVQTKNSFMEAQLQNKSQWEQRFPELPVTAHQPVLTVGGLFGRLGTLHS